MKCKIVLVLCMLSIIFGCVSYRTYANYVASSRTKNIITTNEVKIELVEKTYTEAGVMEAFDNAMIHKVKPGDSFSKIPYVKNVGSEPCYVRINIDTKYDINLTYDINENWIQEDTTQSTKNGWYRYNKILGIGESTEPIFTTVTFSLLMGNEFIGKEITVDLMADAVQSEYNDEFLSNVKGSEGH